MLLNSVEVGIWMNSKVNRYIQIKDIVTFSSHGTEGESISKGIEDSLTTRSGAGGPNSKSIIYLTIGDGVWV